MQTEKLCALGRAGRARRLNTANLRFACGFPRAFTLVEILVVVIILGIAGAIIVPSIGSRDDMKAAAAARVIMADLIYAQNLAITSQGNRYINFDTVNQQYSLTNSAAVVIQHP